MEPKAYVLKETPLTDEEAALAAAFIAAKRAVKRGEKVLEALAPAMTKLLEKKPSVMHDGAFLALGHSYSYTYSAKVRTMEAKLKALKKEEQSSGAAVRKSVPRAEFKEGDHLLEREKLPPANRITKGVLRSMLERVFTGGPAPEDEN